MRDAFLPYCRPEIGGDEIAAVVESLQNGWLTSGPKVREFETLFLERTQTRHAVALASCTAGLHLALLAMGVGPGDEVVMPSLTFVAGAQCAIELGATPVFADVDAETLSITVATLDAVVTDRTKVIIAMPYAGRPLDIDALMAYARSRNILVLEDAAHGCGTLDRGRWAGSASDAAVYSFYATKNVTSAEGGMLVTNDPGIADRVRALSLHGMSRDAWRRYSSDGSWRYDVTEPGFKYNLADPLAALGVVQLRRLEEMQQKRDALAEMYCAGIATMQGLRVQAPVSNHGDRHSWCMFVIQVDERESGIGRDEMIRLLSEANIGTSVHYIPTHLFAAYRSRARESLPVTERVWQRLVSLPLYPSMDTADVESVLSALGQAVNRKTFAASG